MERKSSAPVSSASASSYSPSLAVRMRIGVHTPSSRNVRQTLVAVHAREQHVEDDGVVGALSGPPEAVGPVVGDVDVETLGGQAVGDGGGEELFVFHDQDAHRRIVPFRRGWGCTGPQVSLRGQGSRVDCNPASNHPSVPFLGSPGRSRVIPHRSQRLPSQPEVRPTATIA